MEKGKAPKTFKEDLRSTVSEADGAQLSRDFEAAMPSGSSSHALLGDVKEKAAAQQTSSKVKIHPEDLADILKRVTAHGDERHHPSSDLEASKPSLVVSGDLMEREKLSIGENRPNSDSAENVSESLGIPRRRLSRSDPQKAIAQDGGRKTPEDERTPGPLSSRSKDSPNSSGSEVKQKALDKKGSKQVKGKTCSGAEKEPSSQPSAKAAGKKSVELPFLEGLREGLRDMESDRKVHESLDTFIRQTMGREPYMSFTSRPSEKHQQAANKYVKGLKVDVDLRDGPEDSANVEPPQADLERDASGAKGGGSLGRGLQADRNLHTIKSSVPQAVAALAAAAAKNPGKQNPGTDHFTDVPGWPLLSPSKVQLQKCEKCCREFFSPFNHRRHIRTHRRISNVDKEDRTLKRKNVAAFWDKLNQEEAQQIFASSRTYDLEDLSGEAVVSNLIAFKEQSNSITFPPSYMKAGQDLLDMLDNKQRVFPLFSEQFLSILDEASEKTFLCSQGDVSKIGLEEKNLVASLGFIVEQTLVKAWMADKDAEALRNQQELVKEEEAAQMRRERNVAKKKKKKEKSRHKGLKERKVGATQLALNEENESVDGENPSPEIVEEDNSPTASSASVNSSALENPLLEPPEMELNDQVQNVDGRDHNVVGEDGRLLKSKDVLFAHVTSREVAPDSVDEDRVQQGECDLASKGEEGDSQVKLEDQGGDSHILEQDQSATESRKRTPLRSYKEPPRVDYQDSYGYQRGGWVPDPRLQDGSQPNSYRTLRKPLIGTPYTSSNERGSSPVPGFYRGKPASIRGSALFPATQQWAKKTQTPTAADHAKDGQEDENSQELDAFPSKSSTKDSAIERTGLARETDADTISSNSRAEKEELRTYERREPSPAAVPSVAKVVASTGGLSSMQTGLFNLNENSEDWPSLSDSHAAYYPKSAGMYSLTSYQSELDSRPMNIDGGGQQAGLEGSAIAAILPVRGPNSETPTESTTIGGIMIGSVSVPLGDYVQPSRPEVGSSRISPLLPVHQSYTAVHAAPLVRYTRDPMAATAGQQEVHEAATSHSEFGESSNVQGVDSYGGAGHYRALSLRSTPSINLNAKHVRGPTYPLGDRGERGGILTKQPSWSTGPVRHLPQKVWRPVRSTGENADPSPVGGTGIESSPTSADEKVTAEPAGSEESVNALSRAEGTQVGDMDVSIVEECPTSATKTRAHVGHGNDVLDSKSEKETVLQNVITCEFVGSETEHVNNQQETTSQAASVTNVASEKSNTVDQDVKFFGEDRDDDTEKTDDKTHVETVLSRPAWFAEALELHRSRWNAAMEDPETVVDEYEEVDPELQTTKWVEFLDSLPSIIARSKEDDARDSMRASSSSDQVGGKALSNLLDEQRSSAQNSRQESSGGPRAVSTGEEDLRDTPPCESGSPCGGAGSTAVGSVSGSQNQERGDSEGRIGSRCGSSCSDSSIQ